MLCLRCGYHISHPHTAECPWCGSPALIRHPQGAAVLPGVRTGSLAARCGRQATAALAVRPVPGARTDHILTIAASTGAGAGQRTR